MGPLDLTFISNTETASLKAKSTINDRQNPYREPISFWIPPNPLIARVLIPQDQKK
ncbi:MAG TPA: hypothetical protein VKA40_03335 [Nitrososphaera sp.]|nr:hypothetical protein [Nitrososphaera sp.]